MQIRKWLDDLTVKRSWDAVLLAFSLLILCLGAVSLYASHFSRDAFATQERLHVRQTGALHRTYINLLQAQVAMDRAAELIRVPSFDEPGPVIAEAEALMQDARDAFQLFLDLPSDSQQLADIDALSEALYSLLNVGLNLQLNLLKNDDFGGYRSGRGRVSDMNKAFTSRADQFLANAEAQSRQLNEGFERVVQQTFWALVFNLLAALALILVVRWGITVNVVRPLQGILQHFRALAAGDLSKPLAQRGNNEIGRLYQGVEQLRKGLADIVGRVRSGSETIHSGTADIARANSDLSVRFEQLAASLEQTSASMEELTTTVERNAEHASRGRELALGAHRVANDGNEAVHTLVNSMDRIRAGSEEIAEISNAIQSIAFQTNILALNASVEAAQAGSHGKGFAVVADEVRKLAQRSDSLARDIKAQIENAVCEVNDGVSHAQQAGSTMERIVDAVQQVTDIMDEIAIASREQSLGIDQVRTAVVHMDQVTQQNVHLVAGAASSAAALEIQADELMTSVESFRLARIEENVSSREAKPLPRPASVRCRSAS